MLTHLALFIRGREAVVHLARIVGRIDGGSFGDFGNAFAADGMGSGGTCRLVYGPRVVIAPVMAASMAACG